MTNEFQQMDYSSFQDGSFQEDNSMNEDNNTTEKTYTGEDGQLYSETEWLSPAIVGGPTRQEIEEWKMRHKDVYFIPLDDGIYVFRALKRPEYREIIRNPNLGALDREEAISEKCVLYPRDYSASDLEKRNAGVPSIVSEIIMEKSGFVSKTGAIKL